MYLPQPIALARVFPDSLFLNHPSQEEKSRNPRCIYAEDMSAQSPPVLAHARVTPALQQVQRLAVKSPYVARVVLPHPTAEQRIRTLWKRYPSVVADDTMRSSLRRVGHPALSMVVMPPDSSTVTVLLLANQPPDDREQWIHFGGDKQHAVIWRNYELTTQAAVLASSAKYKAVETIPHLDYQRVTWRLSLATRREYERTIRRLIHGRLPRARGQLVVGKEPPKFASRTPVGIRLQLEKLSEHLANYPGLRGIRTDTWMLSQYAHRLWRKQYPKMPAPHWVRHPYTTLVAANMQPLSALIALQEEEPNDA